jgi:pimeloyl-ACP methyl ester carboxylesterase
VGPINRALGVALVSTVLLAGAGVSSADPLETDSGRPAAIDWKPCAEDATAECGTLRLPIDWAKPWGEKFDLAVARRKATDPAQRTGVMLINPGGPGGSGVDSLLFGVDRFSPQIRAQFDIIGFDPRGVARSAPVRCSLELMQQAPSNYPANQAEFDRLAAFNRDLRNDCRKQSGPMVDHADTLGVIQDMDALRRSLGEKKINYYGVSYGTLIGQQYAERYGDKIRAMVIDSNMDHSLDTRGFLETEARTSEDSFTEWVAWCDRNTACALHGKDVTKVWDGVLTRADRGELHDPAQPERKVTSEEILRRALGAFYGPAWAQLADYVAALDAQKSLASPASAAPELVENPFQAVFCEDWRVPVRDYREYARLYQAERQLAPHMRGTPIGHLGIMSCVGWADQVNNPQHLLDIENAPKILMLNSLHDPATAYEWADNAHRQSRDETVLVTYEGWGHGVYGTSDCTTKAVDDYLLKLTVPRDGTRCAAVEPPIGTQRVQTVPALPRWFS